MGSDEVLRTRLRIALWGALACVFGVLTVVADGLDGNTIAVVFASITLALALGSTVYEVRRHRSR